MKFCKSKTSLRMHCFLYVLGCQEKCDPEGVVWETNDLRRTLICTITNGSHGVAAPQFLFRDPTLPSGWTLPHRSPALIVRSPFFCSHSRWSSTSVPKLECKANVNIKATRTDHESNTTSTLMVHKDTMQILLLFIEFPHGIDFEVLLTYESFSGTAA